MKYLKRYHLHHHQKYQILRNLTKRCKYFYTDNHKTLLGEFKEGLNRGGRDKLGVWD